MTNEQAEAKAFAYPTDPGLPSMTVTILSWTTDRYDHRYRMALLVEGQTGEVQGHSWEECFAKLDKLIAEQQERVE